MSKAEEIAQRLQATYDHQNTDEAAAHLRALAASHQRLVEALEWAMARIKNKAPHQAAEGDSELYAFAAGLAALEQAKGSLMSDIELPDPWMARFEELLEDYAGARAEVACFNATQKSGMTVRLPRPRLIALMDHVADRAKRAQGVQEPVCVDRKVYRNSPEYREYLSARFGPAKDSRSFQWRGNRWAYKSTGFDDAGDFDVIYRYAAPAATESNPVQAEAPVDHRAKLLDCLQDILDAKEVMLAAGVTQADFPTMFKEFAVRAARTRGEGGRNA